MNIGNTTVLYRKYNSTTLTTLLTSTPTTVLCLLTLSVSKVFINVFSARYAQTGYQVKETMDVYIRPWSPGGAKL